MHKISPYSKGSGRDWILTMGKFCKFNKKKNKHILILCMFLVGTGVILATAFVHMLPEALENFSSPCLSEGWQSYSAFAGVFCMMASFLLQLIEMAAFANIERLRAKRKTQLSEDPEKSQSLDSQSTDSTARTPENHDAHIHSAGLFDDPEAFKHISTVILELGIVMHSIIVGITLSNSSNDEFITLLIALVFHQVKKNALYNLLIPL